MQRRHSLPLRALRETFATFAVQVFLAPLLTISHFAKYNFASCEFRNEAEVHVISRKKLKEAAAQHRDLEGPLDVWFRIAKRAHWRSLADVRRTWAATDAVEKWTVFNLKGNRCRLITEINYSSQRIYVRHVLTHAEDGREAWKK
jgi:mRNA interferase HigB